MSSNLLDQGGTKP